MRSCYVDHATRSIADVSDYDAGSKILTRINVLRKHRGQGHATRLLQRVLDDADHDKVAIVLEISPSDGLNFAELEAWYMRHGFVRWRGVYRREAA